MATVAHPDQTIQFDATLRTLAAQARTRYAGEAARIDRGLVIALNGGVTLHEGGTASVTSAPALPEAPASVNVRLCIGGAECQWTLRDMDETRLAERLQALLTRFPQAPAPAPAQTAHSVYPANQKASRQSSQRRHRGTRGHDSIGLSFLQR